MAYVCIIIQDQNNSIQQLNSKLFMPANEAHSGLTAVSLLNDYLSGVKAGVYSCPTFQMTTRDSAPSVSTSGTGSTQIDFGVSLK